GNMISLTRLEANNNQIKEIPKSIAKTKLEYMYLSYNNIQKVPKELEEIKSLKNIYLDYNQISEIEGLLPYDVAYYDLRNQTVSLPLLQYKGEDVEISLPPIFLYNRSKNDFSQKTKIQVYLKGSQVGEALTVSDKGVVILPKSYLSTIKKGDDLYLYQQWYSQNNTYMGNNSLRFTKIEIELPKVPEQEYQALVDIYNQMNGANWGTSNGWKKWSITENNLHEESWSGVTVENGHVTGLNLYYFYYVKGKLPESIKNLEYLKYLNLSSYYIKKDLSGTDWNVISKLKNLETLYLYGNNIQGALPESWGELQKLKYLEVRYNSIDQLPSTIGNMISLTRLEADGNKIKDIPASLIKEQFSIINLDFNNQTISIPELETGTNELIIKLPDMCTFGIKDGKSYLNEVYLYNIYLNGVKKGSVYSKNGMIQIKDIATWGVKYGDKIRVEQLEGYAKGTNIYYDKLTFGRQVDAKEFEILKKFYASTLGNLWTHKWNITQNNLHLENWYGVGIRDGHIISIMLSNNNLMGTIPEEISGLQYLETLNLNSNAIEGELPISIGNLKQLNTLNVFGNKLEGNIPVSLSEIKQIKKIILSNNNLSGIIPASLLNTFTEINELDLSNNYFTDVDNLLTFPYLDIRNQEIIKDEYLELKDDKITIKLNRINQYDNIKSNFNAENTFYLQVNNMNVAMSRAIDDYLTFSDINISEIPVDASIAIWQSNGSAQGTHIRYKGVLRQSNVPVEDQEYQALIKLYNKTNGEQWKEKWDISSNNLHTQSWKGITHNEGHIIEINLSDNNLRGAIPKEIASLPKLKSINFSSNQIFDIEEMFPTHVKVILDRQNIDSGNLPLTVQSVIQDKSINRYDHPSQKFINQTYSITIGDFSKYITIPEDGIKLMDLISHWNIPNNQTINLKQISGTSKNTNIKYLLNYKEGDSNLDGAINILDVQTMINYIQLKKPHFFNYGASDINKDNTINILDVLLLVNQIQNNSLEESNNELNRNYTAQPLNRLSIENNILYIENLDQTVNSFDVRLRNISNVNKIDILLNNDFTVKTSKANGEISILGFSLKEGLAVGKHPIAKISSGTKIHSGILSNGNANKIEFQVIDKTLGIGDIEIEEGSKQVINVPNPFQDKTMIKYNLQENAREVQMIIYDLNGQIVRIIKDLPGTKGNCEYTLFRENLKPGIYLYVLDIRFDKKIQKYKNKIIILN
ncbi:MAG: dockerin type I domain-containing protein, partial [Apibacter sp.]|uniref:leucine-rich repeat domain-containing protein n=1 Tax=Apibacter sp. TaxID=2023709 RepID=UPI0025F712D0